MKQFNVYRCSIYSVWDLHKVLEFTEMLASADTRQAQTGDYQAVAKKVPGYRGTILLKAGSVSVKITFSL